MSTPIAHLQELSRAECLELLSATAFGRVVVTTSRSGTPVIRPVNYRFDAPSQSVVFRTGNGSKLHALAHSAQACFEIDHFEPESRSGWSVIIAGATEEVTAPAEIARFDRLGMVNSSGGPHAHWMRIRARTVSGRRVGPAAPPSAE